MKTFSTISIGLISLLCAVAGMQAAEPLATATKRSDRWVLDSSDAVTFLLDGKDPCGMRKPRGGGGGDPGGIVMHGKRLIARVVFPIDDGTPAVQTKLSVGFIQLRTSGHYAHPLCDTPPSNDVPSVLINGQSMTLPRRTGYRYDAVFSELYEPAGSVQITREIFPSVDKRAAIQLWTFKNIGTSALTIEARSSTSAIPGWEKNDVNGQPAIVERTVGGITKRDLPPGASVSCQVIMTLRLKTEAPLAIDALQERANRLALFAEARQTMVLRTPEPVLNGTIVINKFRVLESAMETAKGVFITCGGVDYYPSMFANDIAQYIAPAIPYLNDATATTAMVDSYRHWQSDALAKGSIARAFQSYQLRRIEPNRGDESMVLDGVSRFLMLLGNKETALDLWPLIEQAVKEIKSKTNSQGVVESKSDELEGRQPTGSANLSTSSAAYGGLRMAARLAKELGKTDRADELDKQASLLEAAIESYFGATIQGIETYRYYDGCTVLRGWISLPVYMGIMRRATGTIQALLSPLGPKGLWMERGTDGPCIAMATASGWPEVWHRETMYGLCATFKAGATDSAIAKTIGVMRGCNLGCNGPLIDEDAADMSSSSALAVRVFTEGLFGIDPQSFTSFKCTPRLPTAWPSMKLSNVWLMGKPVDIEVTRESSNIRCIVSSGAVRLLDSVAADGATFTVDMKAITSVRSHQ